ncbi:ethylene-responsive transcription factor ABI4-like [Enhydra lutris kenyoni]|uniref:Ethylene-responsive transcription factor ABI4-like n=1 Tax=Enhydra lutris kenyoni TaxID=391180 RepID=A0A2Y9K545_ENHLU|nr:ethylene-responsive transcription factor ABI4-like [Enhydra lutris kenyoni]
MVEETAPSRHFASSSRGGGGGGGGSRNWVGAGASLAPSLALSALSARRQEEPAPRRRRRAVGAGARVSSTDSALRRLGPRRPPPSPPFPGAAVAAPQVVRAAPPARAPCAQRPWRILQHHWGPPSRSHRCRRQSPRPPLKGPSPGLCHGILSRGPLSTPRCVPDPSARLARSLRPGECRQRRRPVLGAPGHAAAAAANLAAAVAPPVRQPEMPRPL